jgi:hypothetical protein
VRNAAGGDPDGMRDGRAAERECGGTVVLGGRHLRLLGVGEHIGSRATAGRNMPVQRDDQRVGRNAPEPARRRPDRSAA